MQCVHPPRFNGLEFCGWSRVQNEMLPAGQKLFCSTAIVLGVPTVQAVMTAIKVSTYICHQHCIKAFSYLMRSVQIQVMKLSFFSINLCHFSF